MNSNVEQYQWTAYCILGVHAQASDEVIREAYYRIAAFTHPDHGGSDAEFVPVAASYRLVRSEPARDALRARLALLGDPCPRCDAQGAVARSLGFTGRAWAACATCRGCGYLPRGA